MKTSVIGASVCVFAVVLFGDLTHANDTEKAPRDVAFAYLAAVQAGDLDRAGSLFVRDSSIFESGGDEGNWQHYREHHLGAEIDEISSFSITEGDPEIVTSADGSLALVAWPIEYSIALRDERKIDSRGTVTFVLVLQENVYKIRHLHWSSRKVSSSP